MDYMIWWTYEFTLQSFKFIVMWRHYWGWKLVPTIRQLPPLSEPCLILLHSVMGRFRCTGDCLNTVWVHWENPICLMSLKLSCLDNTSFMCAAWACDSKDLCSSLCSKLACTVTSLIFRCAPWDCDSKNLCNSLCSKLACIVTSLISLCVDLSDVVRIHSSHPVLNGVVWDCFFRYRLRDASL